MVNMVVSLSVSQTAIDPLQFSQHHSHLWNLQRTVPKRKKEKILSGVNCLVEVKGQRSEWANWLVTTEKQQELQ